ncbi:Acetaldehyde dehydrogenase, partial [Frankliniella fusca]
HCAATGGVQYIVFSILQMPMPSKRKYKRHERRVGKTWEDYVLRMLLRNGELEYELARNLGQVVKDDIVYTGGHRGRRLGHGRLRGKEYDFSGWGGNTDWRTGHKAIGSIHSEKTHKLQYRFYIGDSDSSTFAEIVLKCAYGREVRKLHCANHVTVHLIDHLHGLLEKTKEYPVQTRNLLKAESVSASVEGPVTQTRIERLVKGVRIGHQELWRATRGRGQPPEEPGERPVPCLRSAHELRDQVQEEGHRGPGG